MINPSLISFLRWTSLSLIASMAASQAYAVHGTSLPGTGSQMQGTAGAGIASAESAAWMVDNPASIITLKQRMDGSIEYFMPQRFMDPRSPNFTDGTNNHKIKDNTTYTIPSIGVVNPLRCGTWAYGVFGLNGVGVNYTKSRANGITTVEDRRSEYQAGKGVLSYAYPLSDHTTIGMGLHLNFAQFSTDNITTTGALNGAHNKKDHALGGGFQLGFHYRLNPWQFAAAYTSRQWMDSFDRYKNLLVGTTDIPQQIEAGLAYQWLPQLELLLDYKWIHWEGVPAYAETPEKGGFGWRDQNIYQLGARFTVNPKWKIRTGVSYGKSAIPDHVTFANLLFPAANEWHVAAGVSYALNPCHQWHLAYQHSFRHVQTDPGTGDQFSQAGKNSRLGMDANSVILGYSYLW